MLCQFSGHPFREFNTYHIDVDLLGYEPHHLQQTVGNVLKEKFKGVETCAETVSGELAGIEMVVLLLEYVPFRIRYVSLLAAYLSFDIPSLER